MTRTRIAVVGAGYIGLAHIGAARSSPTCALCAVVDPSPAGAAAAAQAGVPHHASLDALLANDRPDGVVVATPNALHVPQALRCLEAELPVLVEKPIAPTLAEGERLVRAVEARNARVLVGHHRAHSPIMAKAREVVASGVLGRLVAIEGSAMFCKPDRYFADGPWRREPGGGPILLNMIHEVHNLRMLGGDIVAVQAIASRAVRGFPVEDTVAIALRFAGGALGTFLLSDTAACGRSWEQTSRENPAYATCEDEDCYVIAGTDGSLSVPTMRIRTYARPEDRSWWKPFEAGVVDLVRDDPIRLQMEHFGAVVRGEVAPIVTARDGLENLRITEAIVEAARTGRLVDTAPRADGAIR
ncbi:myo-inositol 2-dehydrogenase / D-chiro-inositol 1-dehydrogenase [Burkholderiales bacterium]|nr:myo-inositol 2-dehydrogenase / D-chiro-inositol 1-dehydrogenase [Burkholderiales bacterium]